MIASHATAVRLVREALRLDPEAVAATEPGEWHPALLADEAWVAGVIETCTRLTDSEMVALVAALAKLAAGGLRLVPDSDRGLFMSLMAGNVEEG